MDTSDGRRRRRRHSAEFKAQVVAACRRAGVSIAAVALANRLNANLLRRWVVTAEEQARLADRVDAAAATPAPLEVEHRSFIPLQVERAVVSGGQDISIELRRGATVVKVAWPLSAAGECAAWLRELLR